MASIEKRVTSDGKTTYRAKARRLGELPISQTFARRTDALAWSRDIEARADRGFAVPSREQVTRPLSAAIDRWIADRAPELAATDRPNAIAMAGWWRDAIGAIALSRLDAETIEKQRNKLRDETDADGNPARTPQRVNRYLSTLSRILGYAERALRWIDANPCRSVKRFTEPAGRVRFLEIAEVDRLLVAVDARRDRNGKPKVGFQVFVRVSLCSGARRGEGEKLEWRDVDLKLGRLTFRATKTGGDRTVPMPAVLIELLREYGKVRPIAPTARLFPHSYRFDWREVQATLPDFVFHSLRHNLASQIAMGGGSLLDIAATTGHRTLAMVQRYSHLNDQHVRSAVEKAAERMQPSKK